MAASTDLLDTAYGQRDLSLEDLAQLLAFEQQYQGVGNDHSMQWGPAEGQRGKGWSLANNYRLIEEGGGDASSTRYDRSTGQRQLIQVVPGTGGKMGDFWSQDGKYLGRQSVQDGGGRDMNQAIGMIAGGIYGGGALNNAVNGAGAAGAAGTAGSAGMTAAEQAAFLEANAGALAPGGEIAAGYGSTWGVGADGIIGHGATMMANGNPVNQGPPGGPSTPQTPSTPNNPATPRTPNWNLQDTARLAQAGLRVLGSTTNGDGGGGIDGEPDQRLLDAQLRSMDTQEALMQRMISNADMIMPFQRDALDFGLQTAKEAYGDYRDDRTYALGRRNLLTGLQDRMVADANNFNTEAKREELAGMAIGDVNKGFSSALDQTARTMTRRGQNPNDGRWGSAVRQLVADKVLAQTQAANQARSQARQEGYALTDRAAGALGNSPGLVTQSTSAGQGAGAQPIGMTGATAQAIQNGITPAAQLAGQWGNNATSMYSAQQRNGGSGGTDWSGYGALLAGAAKAWDAFGS